MLKFLIVTVGVLSSPQGEYKDHAVDTREVPSIEECKAAESSSVYQFKGDVVIKQTRCVIIHGA